MKKILSVILAAVMLASIFTALPVMSFAESSGSCGTNATYTLDNEGKLTISGSGDMYDYSRIDNPSPFDTNTQITSVVIEKGVTGIGKNTFAYCTNLTSVNIPDSVNKIGVGAFMYCENLEYVMIPEGVTKIPTGTFLNCVLL